MPPGAALPPPLPSSTAGRGDAPRGPKAGRAGAPPPPILPPTPSGRGDGGEAAAAPPGAALPPALPSSTEFYLRGKGNPATYQTTSGG